MTGSFSEVSAYLEGKLAWLRGSLLHVGESVNKATGTHTVTPQEEDASRCPCKQQGTEEITEQRGCRAKGSPLRRKSKVRDLRNRHLEWLTEEKAVRNTFMLWNRNTRKR